MLKRTPLLEYVFTKGQQLASSCGKKTQNSNYFLAALYTALDAYAAGAHFEELSTPEGEAEMASVFKTLCAYGKAFDDKSDALLAAVKADGYSSMADDLLFGMFAYKAEGRAKKDGKDAVDTPAFLSVVLAEPTAAIRAVVLKETTTQRSDSAQSESAPESAPTAPEKKEEALAPTEAPTPPKKKKNGRESLAASIASARSVRDSLLSRVCGQDVAVATFVSGYFQSSLMAQTRVGLRRPAAAFLFAGPPGVGKTFLAECAAEALSLPFLRFDMSEYAGSDGASMLSGTEKVYKDSKAGTLTGFVAKNPRSVLLFDEIEKAHPAVIHLFLQILDAGRLRDAYTEKEVLFSETVIIFTTNAGRSLYEDPTVGTLSTLPKKTVLKAIAADRHPITGGPLFPNAICSRFSSGHVVMFNHLSAHDLSAIAKRELCQNTEGFSESTGIAVGVSDEVATAVLLAEGGRAEARAVKGRANAFFHEEMYELFRLMADDPATENGKSLQAIDFSVYTEGAPEDIAAMFVPRGETEILLFAEEGAVARATSLLSGVRVHTAHDLSRAKEILFENNVTAILCDVRTGVHEGGFAVLNAEDIRSEGRELLGYALAKHDKPVYLLCEKKDDISTEEFLSFAREGVRGVIAYGDAEFSQDVTALCRAAHAQAGMLRLARENKVLTYKSSQRLSEDGQRATIYLFDFRLSLARDRTDAGNILEGAGKPSVRFADVIGAEGAKEELKYFIDYLKDPVSYLRRGVHAPKGVLLYGPPGTGKTMLARAMAGESDVTFLTAEGNQFLKKYVGEGPEAVHALFATARKYAPSILFVDEIDAIAKSRDGSDADHTADILTAFLTEMDGFHTDTTKPVFVLAATNYSLDSGARRHIDSALLRRFDRRIYVELPGKRERMRFLEMKRKAHPTARLSDEMLESIAARGTGMSLAALSQVFEMALRSAIRTGGEVTDASFEEAFESYVGGDAKTHSEAELLRTARHEAGHALLCYESGEVPAYVTVVARGDHGGYMQHAEQENKGFYTKEELIASIRTALGGRAAELVYYGERDGVTTGASGDLAAATAQARRMLCRYGMDEDFGLAVVEETEDGALGAELRARVNDLLSRELAIAKATVEKHRDKMDALVSALLEKNRLKGDEIAAILGK